ncbi:MAG: SDR family NAD(P)-dependent oxidoreductase [Solidesulfovibrio sp. DCME]|uniref:SDR family NAD(P)-dependent oxidoreductase n=1 Tax=Solidesulfovibrio sp. DCME TaxID=3447380 RepID=UPI003D0C19BA
MSAYLKGLFDLTGHTALVTGASGGLGWAMARALGQAGASLVLVARDPARLDAAARDLAAAGGSVRAIPCDLAAGDTLADLARLAAADGEAPDILVNAAGVNPRLPWEAVTPEAWDATLRLNLTVPFFLARELVAGMRRRGFGRIINLASLQSVRAFANGAPYGASKGGVAQLTRAMAQAWSGAASGITANAIAPGFFRTALTASLFADERTARELAGQTVVGRSGEPEDIEGLTVFLASPAAAYVTGQVVFCDGGWSAV